MTPPVLAMRGMVKRFGGATAVADVDLIVRAGSVHAILGENGAGKTTLLRMAFGIVRPDSGTILVDGAPVALRSAADAIARGIGMVHQHFSHVPAMTVLENAAMGGTGRFDPRRTAAMLRATAADAGFDLDPFAPVGDLSVADQQRLEIAKALFRGARLLIMDEPTAVLGPADAAELMRWIRGFAARGGAVVLITHTLRDALGAADEITVLRLGRAALHTPAGNATVQSLTVAMLGDVAPPADASDTVPHPTTTHEARVTVQASGMTYEDASGVARVRDASFALREGDIVGVAGVDRSGVRELLALLAGRLPPTTGLLTIPDGVAFIPADRHGDALILDFTIVENVALTELQDSPGRMPWDALHSAARSIVATFDVRGASSRARVRSLSGGNQQKLVLGRALARRPEVMVADNPTRGLDVGAAASIRDRLRYAAARGATIVVHSPDLDELAALATRMLVVHGGRVIETPVDRTAAGAAMLGSG
jgi:ABC-type uncharacterized transport system ATPase subunit